MSLYWSISKYIFEITDNYLVVGNDNHDDCGVHLDDLLQFLDVRRRSIVWKREHLRFPHLHPKRRRNFLQALDELGRDGRISSNNVL